MEKTYLCKTVQFMQNHTNCEVQMGNIGQWYTKAEDRMGVTRTNGIPGLPGNNNYKVLEAGAKKLGYKEVHTGRMAINSEPRDDRAS